MRIGRIAASDTDFAVQAADGTWVGLRRLGIAAETTEDVIPHADAIRARIDGLSDGIVNPRLLAPIVRPSKVVAIGLNYRNHVKEIGATIPAHPIVFAKFPSAINDPDGDIVVDRALTQQPDYEVELAVVMGRTARNVDRARAAEYVFGYAVANDVSARDWQQRDGQFDRSKGFDSFCPIGPWITTADDVPDANNVAVRSWVNGELRQSSTTADMVFPVDYLIWYITRGMTLLPGDVLLTGTPHGVGSGMKPPRYLAPGDVVECLVDGLGSVRNRVVDRDGTSEIATGART